MTDIHINFLIEKERSVFFQKIKSTHSDAILITGDIAEAPNVEMLLSEMADHTKMPIYFVLGNHDYYRGNVSDVREAVTTLTKSHDMLFWLPASGIQTLENDTLLLGHDGWADGRLGDYQNSTVELNDSRMIVDLYQQRILGRSQLLQKMQQLADADASEIENDLIQAVSHNPKKIIVLTHVPPFREACQHMGKISDDDWLPFFSSKVVGDVLMKVATNNPSIDFLVLCGHTHSEANFQPLKNLQVKAGMSEYYHPLIQEIITI